MSIEDATEPDEQLQGLESRLPIGWALVALVGAGNIASTVFSLLAQA